MRIYNMVYSQTPMGNISLAELDAVHKKFAAICFLAKIFSLNNSFYNYFFQFQKIC